MAYPTALTPLRSMSDHPCQFSHPAKIPLSPKLTSHLPRELLLRQTFLRVSVQFSPTLSRPQVIRDSNPSKAIWKFLSLQLGELLLCLCFANDRPKTR